MRCICGSSWCHFPTPEACFVSRVCMSFSNFFYGLLWSSTSVNFSIREDRMRGNHHQQTFNTYTRLTMATSKLFQPIQVGTVALQHRVVMAPVTRYRGNAKHTRTDLVVEHYAAHVRKYLAHCSSARRLISRKKLRVTKVGLVSSATVASTCNSNYLLYPR